MLFILKIHKHLLQTEQNVSDKELRAAGAAKMGAGDSLNFWGLVVVVLPGKNNGWYFSVCFVQK